MGRTGLSGRLMTAAADGFWQAEHAGLTDPYINRFFQEAPDALLAPNIALPVWSAAYPRLAVSAQTVTLAEAMLLRRDLSQVLRRVAIDQTADLRQAIAARG
jgi:aminopeptidase N